jgi:hypothetical protein
METVITNMESLIARRLVILSLISEYTAKGLGNCRNVAMLKKELAQISFDRYRDKYPTYLFFTDEQFDEIVKRNELVKSTIEAYTGYIPDECFKAVQNENIDREDYRPNLFEARIDIQTLRFGIGSKPVANPYLSVYSNIDIHVDDEGVAFLKELDHVLYLTDNRREIYKGALSFIAEKGGIDIKALYRLIHGKYTDHNERELYNIKLKSIQKAALDERLLIAAPVSMIDREKEQKPSVFKKYFSVTKQEQPKDPIVFRYVKDGLLVITFWK